MSKKVSERDREAVSSRLRTKKLINDNKNLSSLTYFKKTAAGYR